MAQDIQQFTGQLPQPSARAQAKAKEMQQRFTAGIASSFPVMSLKGSRFTLRIGQQEHPFLYQGMPAPVEVILVNSSPYTNKAFYISAYDGASKDAPDCWSNDGVYPDVSIPPNLKQNPTCNGCRWNKFGTARMQDGSPGKGKACADMRRLAIAFPQDLIPNQVGPISLRATVTTLTNLKPYVDHLATAGFPPNGCVTRLTFAGGLSYQKLEFTFVRPLTDDEYDIVEQWENDERTQRIMAAPPEGDAPSINNPNVEPRYAGAQTGVPPAPPAPGPVPPPMHSAPIPENHPVINGGAGAPVTPVVPEGLPLGGNLSTIQPAPSGPVAAAPPFVPQAPVGAPPSKKALPPHVIELSNGQFYDTIQRTFVDAAGQPAAPPTETPAAWQPPASGAPTFQPAEAAPKRTRRKAADTPAEGVGEAEEAAPTLAGAPPPMENPPASEAAPQGAQPAPADLENVLSGFVMPPR